MVTTHDSARARAYTADLVSHGVRSRVASPPRPAPPPIRSCRMRNVVSIQRGSPGRSEFAPELLGGRFAHCQPQALGGVISLAATPHARTRGAPHQGTAGMR